MDFSGGVVSGMDDLERMLRDAIKSTFEARAAAYDEQVRLCPFDWYGVTTETVFMPVATVLHNETGSHRHPVGTGELASDEP